MAKDKKKRKPRDKGEQVKMDMTPMIDVTFLLLIFFLCLEFKTLEGKLATNLPKDVGVNTSSAMPIEKLDLRIVNTEWGRQVPDKYDARRFELEGHRSLYFLGAKQMRDDGDLDSSLRQAAKVKVTDMKGKVKPRPITIKTGPGVTYGDVTKVVDMALDAGFEEITFGGGEGTRQSGGRKSGE